MQWASSLVEAYQKGLYQTLHKGSRRSLRHRHMRVMLEADNLDTALHDFALFDPLLRSVLLAEAEAYVATALERQGNHHAHAARLDRLEQLRLSQSHEHRNS